MAILNLSHRERTLPVFLTSIYSFSKQLFFAKKPELSADELENARKKAQVFNPESKISADQIKVFTSSDPVLLKRYYELRHESFRNENGWKEYDGSENEFDKEAKIIIATNKDGEVIGGGRVMLSSISTLMSSEYPDEGYSFKEILQKEGFDTDKEFFSEVSAFVVAKEYRNRYITESLFRIAIKISLEDNCKYIVGVGNILCCRDYCMTLRRLGYSSRIKKDLPWIRKKIQNFSQGYMIIVPIYLGSTINN